ncbi:MAG: response regulator [Gemmataceae bacterium]
MTALHPYSVLITHHDPGEQEILRQVVESEGCQPVLASSGEEALDVVQEKPVHLALLDMHLPTLTGLETLKLIRQTGSVIPCILLTSETGEVIMRMAFRAKAFSVIPKPVRIRIVRGTVVKALIRVYGKHEETGQNQETTPTNQYSR